MRALLLLLAGLKDLTTLSLARTQVTDAVLKTLREMGLLHALAQTRTAGGGRPTRPEDVISLYLFGMPVTDEGLKELAGLPNLTCLRGNSTFGLSSLGSGVSSIRKSGTRAGPRYSQP